jgi:hypothetical protein
MHQNTPVKPDSEDATLRGVVRWTSQMLAALVSFEAIQFLFGG